MMLSKHGPWKFVDGNATILDHEDEMENYKKKGDESICTILWTFHGCKICTHSILQKCQKH